MTRKSYIILFFLSIFFCSCEKESDYLIDNNGVIIKKRELWSTKISIDGRLILSATNSIKYDNIAVVGTGSEEALGIMGLDVKTGEKLWSWFDTFHNQTFYIEQPYIYDHFLIWNDRREIYCIDISSGKTVFKQRFDSTPYFWYIDGEQDQIFLTANKAEINDYGSTRLFSTSISEKGNLTEVVHPNHAGIIDINGSYSSGGPLRTIKSEESTFVLLNTMESDGTQYGWCSYIHLYDVSNSQWVYERKLLTDQARSIIQKKPGIWNNHAYFVMNDWVICTDLWTGEVIWKRGFSEPTHFVDGGYYIAEKEGYLLINAEGSKTTLYALDLEHGNEIWSEPSSGTSTEMAYLNGVVYFVGGGDGHLHAVDVSNGDHLWKLRSPGDGKGDYFSKSCMVFPGEDDEKGKVVVSTWKNAYSYEAER